MFWLPPLSLAAASDEFDELLQAAKREPSKDFKTMASVVDNGPSSQPQQSGEQEKAPDPAELPPFESRSIVTGFLPPSPFRLALDGKGHSFYMPPPEAAAWANVTALDALPDRRGQASASAPRPGRVARASDMPMSALLQVTSDATQGPDWLETQDALMQRWNERLFKRDEQAVRGAEFSAGLLAPGWAFQEAPGEPHRDRAEWLAGGSELIVPFVMGRYLLSPYMPGLSAAHRGLTGAGLIHAAQAANSGGPSVARPAAHGSLLAPAPSLERVPSVRESTIQKAQIALPGGLVGAAVPPQRHQTLLQQMPSQPTPPESHAASAAPAMMPPTNPWLYPSQLAQAHQPAQMGTGGRPASPAAYNPSFAWTSNSVSTGI